MTEPRTSYQIVSTALARARNTYMFALLLLGAFWFMSGRAGWQLDRIIPEEKVYLFRIGEGVVLIVGMVISGLVTRRLMSKRGEALGQTPATDDLVAEDFVAAKTLVAMVFGTAAFLGLLLVLAVGKKLDLLLLILPLVLLVLSWPTSATMGGFAKQVNEMRGIAPPEPQSAEGGESSAGQEADEVNTAEGSGQDGLDAERSESAEQAPT
ncbi:MAG: hypothetical protein JXQ73_32045 [Phycisphaerae bacterium]|nr:hypothetical protein [Phycisphaerae bacterium]